MKQTCYIEFDLRQLCKMQAPDTIFFDRAQEMRSAFSKDAVINYCLKRETKPNGNGIVGVTIIVFDRDSWYAYNGFDSIFDILTGEEVRILKHKHVGGHPQYVDGYKDGRKSYRDLAIKAFCENCIATSCGCGHIDRDEKFYLSCDRTEEYIKLLDKFEKDE